MASGASGPPCPDPFAASPIRETFLTWVSACQSIIDQYQRIAASRNANINIDDLRAATSDNLVNLATEYIELLRNMESDDYGDVPEHQRPLGNGYVASIRVYRSYVIHVWARQYAGVPFRPFPVFPNAEF